MQKWGDYTSEVNVFELIVYGIVLGSIISLGAIGLSLVYGILQFANFAHGDLMTAGAYVALFMVTGPLALLGIPDQALGPFSFGWRIIISFPVSMLAVAGIAIALDRILFRKLRNKGSNRVIMAMSALGASFIIRMSIMILWGADFKFYKPGILRQFLQLPLEIRIRPDQVLILAVVVVLVVALHLFLKKTKLGKAMRATSDNMDLARISGIDIERIIIWTWAIGGALAAAAGILYGIDIQINPGMGWRFLLPLFAATILGSIGNIYGALVGGLVVGVAQQVSTAFLLPTYKPAVAFLILIIILLIRPKGIFGGQK
jgi:branched-chain amino acid transport system permease protein/neutral amino acid transport system permease protein